MQLDLFRIDGLAQNQIAINLFPQRSSQASSQKKPFI
jgi:hypothetical protein